jgi:hypothetical protein
VRDVLLRQEALHDPPLWPKRQRSRAIEPDFLRTLVLHHHPRKPGLRAAFGLLNPGEEDDRVPVGRHLKEGAVFLLFVRS